MSRGPDDPPPFAELLDFIDRYCAQELLEAIEAEADRELQILAHPDQFQMVRHAICTVRPDMESCVKSSRHVSLNQVIFMRPPAFDDWLAPDLNP